MAGKAITHELYISRLKEAWGDEFVLLESYKGGKIPMNHLHVPCGTVKPLRSDHLLGKGKNRRGCKKCNNVRRTHAQFIEEIKSIHGDEITVIGTYTLAHEKIDIIHNKCGQRRIPYAGHLLQGYKGCRPCALNKMWNDNTLTHEEFEDRINEAHDGDVIPLGKYTGVREEMEFHHVSCGRKWTCVVNNVMRGHSCEHCARDAKRLTEEQFTEKLYEIYQEEIVWIDGEYYNYKSILSFKNTKCGHEFDRMAGNMLTPVKRLVNNCSRCSSSKGEARIESFLKSVGLKFTAEHTFPDCRNINVLPFDFVVLNNDSSIKFLIEFDGQEHFEPVEYFGGEEKHLKRLKNDQIKNEYCRNNNINLIRIPYWEFDNIETILEEALGLEQVTA